MAHLNLPRIVVGASAPTEIQHLATDINDAINRINAVFAENETHFSTIDADIVAIQADITAINTALAAVDSNLVINGGMAVSQASVATAQTGRTGGYIVDGFWVLFIGTGVADLQQVVDAPAGLTYSAKISVTTGDAAPAAGSYYVLATSIEGNTIAHLGFGTVTAQSLSLGFWVKAHRIGSYSGAVQNYAGDRAYPYSFTVNAADTWEFKSVTIPGDTAGAWVSNAGGALVIYWALALGSTAQGPANAWAAVAYRGVTDTVNGFLDNTDTFQVTGVALVSSSVALTASNVARFIRSFPEEFELCQRYYQKSFAYTTVPAQNVGANLDEYTFQATKAGASAVSFPTIPFAVRMCATPAITLFNPAAANGQIRDITAAADCSAAASRATDHNLTISGTGNASTAVANILGINWVADARI